MKTAEPLVSIVTPVHNGAAFLGESMRSVLDQKYQNWEYIVLNNASTDNTAEIAKQFARQDSRIRVYENESLLPIMTNWNRALEFLSPESRYCKILHADDQLIPECLVSMVEVAERPHAPAMIGALAMWGNTVECDGLPYPQTDFSGRDIGRDTLLGKFYPFLSPSCLLIRTDVISNRKPFYRGEQLHADVEMCFEVLQDADFGFVHQVLTVIGKHSDSITAKDALPMNTLIASNFELLVKYGPVFLTQKVFKQRVLSLKLSYHRFLLRRRFVQNPEGFWRYHLDTLMSAGYPVQGKDWLIAALRESIAIPRYVLRGARRLRARSRS